MEKILMLALSPTMEKGKIVRWHKSEGEMVAEGDLLMEVETDKAVMEYESAVGGRLAKIVKGEGEMVSVGELVAYVGEGAIDEVVQPVATEVVPSPAPPERLKISPLARAVSKELGLMPADLVKITGSGPGGRIVRADLPKSRPVEETRAATAGEETRIAHSSLRKIIAARLSQSFFTAPHYYLKMDVDATALLAWRGQLKAKGIHSFNSVLVKLVAAALSRHPLLNSSWEDEATILHSQVDIALAVAKADGLITPVVRNVTHKGLVVVEQELQALIEKAKQNKLTPDEYSRSTFTISNLGSYGVDEFTAIINPPNVAILAVGRLKRVASWSVSQEKFLPTDQISFTLSVDHRAVDGAVAAQFMADLKNILENPMEALL